MREVRSPLPYRRKAIEAGKSAYQVVPGMRTDQARRNRDVQRLHSHVAGLPVPGE